MILPGPILWRDLVSDRILMRNRRGMEQRKHVNIIARKILQPTENNRNQPWVETQH